MEEQQGKGATHEFFLFFVTKEISILSFKVWASVERTWGWSVEDITML